MNNELKLNVGEQQKDIKHCDIDDDAGGQEITAAIIPMKKNNDLCVTCN